VRFFVRPRQEDARPHSLAQTERGLCAPVGFGVRSTLAAQPTLPEKFVHGFDAMLCASGMESVVMPPRSPNLNAHYERFVRSIKEAALHQMMVIGEADCSAS
jgi:hypothetical protein